MKAGPRVCVLGAGPSGLAMGRALHEAGVHDFVLYERQGEVGGNWTEGEACGHSSVYEGVRSISSRRCMAFAGFAFPKGTPDYPTRHDLQLYLKSFARTFGLEAHLRLGVEVASVEKGETGWHVTLASGETERFDAVCVCNGHHSVPLLPEIKGHFAGRLLHSHDFRTSFGMEGARVLVVGGGNSAADLAVDLARRCGQVTMSLRRGYHVVPRHVFGMPSDELHARLHWLPNAWLSRLSPLLFRLSGGPMPRALPKPDHRLFETHPLIHAELPKQVASGAIRIRGPVAHAAGNTITFADGSADDFDLLLACTGYRIAFPFLKMKASELPPAKMLRLGVFHPEYEDLFFLGLIQPNGSIWPLADLQARLVAKALVAETPPESVAVREGRTERYRGTYVASPRHALEVDFFRYRRALRRELERTG